MPFLGCLPSHPNKGVILCVIYDVRYVMHDAQCVIFYVYGVYVACDV